MLIKSGKGSKSLASFFSLEEGGGDGGWRGKSREAVPPVLNWVPFRKKRVRGRGR